nr:immunoglobulin heavy chain junction region [Macaca mulatta]MPN69400.1 immunoglobulin heavy chain junction region [Macaca mulatta]MPN69504.1 immunoglobulin heavy chain junction region [Macaca mulatta]MPN69719.1 immunoglobulin heavy chain junction region [Macaca mulatta]MPN69729.1 immunoglobulin heavy chain junction region [Macaca mulatta]
CARLLGWPGNRFDVW